MYSVTVDFWLIILSYFEKIKVLKRNLHYKHVPLSVLFAYDFFYIISRTRMDFILIHIFWYIKILL